MPSKNYRKLIGIFQKIINRAPNINSLDGGIYDDKTSMDLIEEFTREARQFLNSRENKEEEKINIRSLVSAKGDLLRLRKITQGILQTFRESR